VQREILVFRNKEFFCIFYQIAVSLFGKEELAICRELLVSCITGNNGVKVGD
jgi:hypothetical protein